MYLINYSRESDVLVKIHSLITVIIMEITCKAVKIDRMSMNLQEPMIKEQQALPEMIAL